MEKSTLLDFRNVTGRVYEGPVKVHSITIAGDGANGDCDIYNSLNVDATRRKLHLEVLSGTSHETVLKGTIFDRGIYVVVNAATTFVTTEYEPFV